MKKYCIEKFRMFVTRKLTEQLTTQMDQHFVIVILICSQMMNLSYSMQPRISMQASSYYYIIAITTRPHLLLTVSQYEILLLLILGVNSCLLIRIILIFVIPESNQKQIPEPFAPFSSFMTQIYDIWLINIFGEVLLQGSGVLNILCGITTLVNWLLTIFITKQSISYNYYTLYMHHLNLGYYLIQLVNIVQIILTSVEWENQTILQTQMIIALLSASLQIIYASYLPYSNISLIVIVIVFQVTSGIYILIAFGFIFSDTDLAYSEPVMLIAFLFVVRLTLNIFNHESYKQLKIKDSKYSFIFQKHFINSQISKTTFDFQLLVRNGVKDKLQETQSWKIYNSFMNDFEQIELLNYQGRYYEAMTKIKKIYSTQTDILIQCRLNVLFQYFQSKLQGSLINQNYGANQLTQDLQIRKFIDFQNLSKLYVDKIRQIIFNKIQLYNHTLNKSTNIDSQRIINILKLIDTLVADLYVSNTRFKDETNLFMKLLVFCYAELKNDFIKAQKIFQSIKQVDEVRHDDCNISIFNKDLGFNLNQLLSSTTVYLNIDLITLQIVQQSNNVNQFFEQKDITVEQLIPEPIRKVHHQYVEEFVNSGNSKFFRKTNESYYQSNDSFVNSVQQTMDIKFDSNQVCAVMFFQRSVNPMQLIILDDKMHIKAISIYFGQFVQYSLLGLHITHIIPQFATYEFDIYSDLYFQFPLSLRTTNQRLDQSSKSSKRQYLGNGVILNRENAYYIIKCNELSLQTAASSDFTTNQSVMNIHDHTIDHDENIQIIKPYIDQMDPFNTIRTENRVLVSEQQIGLKSQPYFIAEQDHPKEQLLQMDDSNRNISINVENKVENSDNSSLQYNHLKFSNQYQLIEKIQQSNKQNRNSTIEHAFLFTYTAITVTYMIIQFKYNYDFINNNNKQFRGVVLKYDLFQPLSSFIVTSFAAQYYQLNKESYQVSEQAGVSEYQIYIEFQKIIYQDTLERVQTIQNTPQLKDWLQSYRTVWMQIDDDNNGKQYTLKLDNILNIVLQTQFYFWSLYGELSTYDQPLTYISTPQSYFLYKNFNSIYDEAESESLIQYNFISNISQQIYSQGLLMYLIFSFIALLLLCLKYVYRRQYLKTQNSIIGLLDYSLKQHMENESKKYQIWINKINDNANRIIDYNFNIEEMEQKIGKQDQINPQTKTRYSFNNRQKISYHQFFQNLSIFSIFIIFSIPPFVYNYKYLSNFDNTLKFQKAISDLSVDIPTLFAYRELLYNREDYLFLSTQLNEYYEHIDSILPVMQISSDYLSHLPFDEFLYSSTIISQIRSLLNDNVCKNQAEDSLVLTEQICDQPFQGTLNKGLLSVLSFLKNHIVTEQAINNFTLKSQYPPYELEGCLIITQALEEVADDSLADYVTQTELLDNKLTIILIFYLIVTIIGIGLYVLIYIPMQNQEYHFIKRIIYIIPLQSLLQDGQFERQCKYVYAKFGIV